MQEKIEREKFWSVKVERDNLEKTSLSAFYTNFRAKSVNKSVNLQSKNSEHDVMCKMFILVTVWHVIRFEKASLHFPHVVSNVSS